MFCHLSVMNFVLRYLITSQISNCFNIWMLMVILFLIVCKWMI